MTRAEPTGSRGRVEPGDGLQLYRRMQLIRRFEDEVHQLLLKGHVHGTTHLYSGQEASAVGVCSMLEPGDRVAATYRGHGAALAMGVEPEALMAELLGRSTGVCAGRAGSMNVVDLEHGLIGCFGIIGGSIAAATGQALANQIRRTDAVSVAFFGDGATNQAYFHECLNFASIRRLPLILACENNLYAEFTPLEDATAGTIAARPAALDITTEIVDANDVWTVQEATGRAVEHARHAGPVFLELRTYRFVGHSRSDPALYRKPGELDAWRKRDPLLIARQRLEEEHGASSAALDEVDAAVERELEQLIAAALAAPWPDPSAPISEFAGAGR
jgi:TPP-dependent pyruvate/acetoin dehydrogenase alpha subunit